MLRTAGAAVLFGLIASLIIGKMTPVFRGEQTPVQFEQDPTPTPAPSPTVAPSPTPVITPEITPAPEPEVTPAPDPEEESAHRIEENQLLYSDLREIASDPQHSVVTVTGITVAEDWFGAEDEDNLSSSGIIVADNGSDYLILTDTDLLGNAQRILVTFYDGSIIEGTRGKSDDALGLGIIVVDKESITPETQQELAIAELGNSHVVSQGEPVIAIGSPMGYVDSVVFGQITSTTNRIAVTDASYPLLMTSIQGASGGSGALINMQGEVIGFIAPQFASGMSGNIINAIPISRIKSKIELLSNNEAIAYLGIIGEDVTEEVAAATELPQGIYVTDVVPDSPAFVAGIRRGDIMARIGEQETMDMMMLGQILNNGMAGTTQRILVRRLGAGGYVDVEVEAVIGAH